MIITMRFVGGPLDGETMSTPEPPPDSFASTDAGTYDLWKIEPTSRRGFGTRTAIYHIRVETGESRPG